MPFSPHFLSQGSAGIVTVKNGLLTIPFRHGFRHICKLENGCILLQISTDSTPDTFSCARVDSQQLLPDWSEKDNFLDIECIDGTLSIDTENGGLHWMQKEKTILKTEEGLGFGFLGQETLATFHLEQEHAFFGLGEKTGKLNRRGSGFTNWNTDAFAYGDGRDPLYVSIPFYMIVYQGICYGILVDNTVKTRFNFGASNDRMVQISVAFGPLNLVFIPGPSPREVLKRYSELTGTTPMPPKWALGLQQCRYSYYPENEIRAVATQYRERDIPCDVLYLDIHYMQDYKVFTVNEERFPRIKQMTSDLGEMGFRIVPIQDPGIKDETGYSAYDSGMEKNIFVRYPDGKPWKARVWPGLCLFPDFTSEKARNWWSELTSNWVKQTGMGGLWNDMNEPATWGQDVPDMVEFDLEGRCGSHLEAHNVYGQLMAAATRSGLQKAKPEERPFVLTRAGFAGIQRYAAVWTGDNVANEEHLFLGIRLVLSLGISGVSFSGVDVGGFVGNASRDLFVRWMSIASFFPFFRIHSMIDSHDNEPWSYGERAESIVRNYIRLRYRLMPMLYNAFRETHFTGMPVLRPYFWSVEGYRWEQAFEHQFFFGDSILVIPAASDQQAVYGEFPTGSWYHLFTGQCFIGNTQNWIGAPIDVLPVFIKGGSLLLTQNVGTHTLDPKNQVFQLHIFKGEGSSHLYWYDDDGLSVAPRPEDRMDVDFYFDFSTVELSVNQLDWGQKTWPVMTVHFWHFGNDPMAFRVNGKEVQASPGIFSWMDPLPNFDPFEDKSKRYFDKCLVANLLL